MPRRLTLATHLTVDERHARYRQATDPVARSHWQIIWLRAQGTPTAQVATATGYTQPWIRSLAHRYNAGGPAALGDRRPANPGDRPLLNPTQQAQLATRLEGPAPAGGRWTGPKVATWMADQLGHPVHPQRGTDEVVGNRHFTTLDDLQDVQAEQCLRLSAQPDRVRANPVSLVADGCVIA